MRRAVACAVLLLASVLVACPEQIAFSAAVMSGTAGDKNSATTLKGNAKVKTENMEIAADQIELYGKDFRYIKATGSVSGKNTETKMDFSCKRLTYDRKTKVSKLEGGVEFIDVENEVKAKAGLVEYDQDKEIAVMQIQVTILQKDNVCTSAYAVYKKNEQVLELSGNPKIVQNDDTFRAQTIELDLDSQDIKLIGKVQGSVSTEDDNSSSSQKGGSSGGGKGEKPSGGPSGGASGGQPPSGGQGGTPPSGEPPSSGEAQQEEAGS